MGPTFRAAGPAPVGRGAVKTNTATKRAELMKKLSSNPRFKAAKKSGRAYVIPGARRKAAFAALVFVLSATTASAQQTTFRNANGQITGTVSTDSNGQQTFRDGSGRTTGT